MDLSEKYEVVIGLEVHAQLLTSSKLFCGDSIAFGAPPNTHVSPITLAHPGSLPKMNEKAIEYAVKLGLACHCDIEQKNYFARKNYFYPDLPKGYQISQHTTPICKNGFITVKTSSGTKNIRLNRIHMEEDAGKSLHDVDAYNTAVDYNRAGTPLVEIVTEPDIRSSEEAFAYITELRKLVRYLEVCDGNMEEGSLRCDANISVRLKGAEKLGTKVEVKNLNSIRNVKKAIDFEAERLMNLLEKGATIRQQTRSFDAGSGTTFAIRDKEDAEDYRYFPDPDLPPFDLKDAYIAAIRSRIPALPAERIQRYTLEYQLPEYDAQVITEEREVADYFEAIIQQCSNYKAAANWMLGPVKNWLNEHNTPISCFPIKPDQIAGLVDVVGSGKVSFSIASTKLFQLLLQHPDETPLALAEKNNLIQQSATADLEPVVNAVLERLADKVIAYKKGKKGLLALFVGEVMKQTKGKADPKKTNELLLEKLK
ncbi:aspartyl/glutamyl-tRNA amidotransferase subunit B [Niabella ginsenosidivorans]|uniref:Aspartyl/glutamyl-tRNA(Asn/Gln) amidotransferase subunit B n=1 Tax=Niabella ginsenosidivorans TaxID=1176587 RepID=A0A1A9I9I0_9BACT|nr:Asp-tRNA(Asn)/Glu-tRNA(Gln) amidotransferase subunit GatB [Niabella ginsenosidivorans]ANH83380.1 aspartyl/glutamyl-tRNA amidotransferase subunit B [Niabella ginsenosidivorans]